ncbi:geranylgeranyl diphosphate synthase type I [Methanofollis sp. W23]|uniref:polyprenyl synthetase family protein n=1 Tax=Methanofollis sp. W23 TaxID=2817849 RepID=UPI001AE7B9E2|nr:polyprenyl synthetase family protein [Methanofollis sp. W23]MBP2147073.1 geranylgeranyl diphosphate synthase type I [Methanofollis sp. W23]
MSEDLKDYLDKTAEQVDMMLERYFSDAFGELYKASAHLLLAGGKRLRPAVLLLAAEAVRPGSSDDLMHAAIGLEMTHTFTLIHDDIMDGDATRRGAPTVHVKWDEPTAILAGDVLYAKAFEFITHAVADDRARVKAVAMLARTCAEICEGQHQDMAFEKAEKEVDAFEYLEMAGKKTGALYAASAAIGGVLAGGNAVQVDALYQYGMNAGIAFQIQDDLIDFIAPPEKSGKDRGSDLREGKQTLIAITAREKGLNLSKYRRPDLTPEEVDRAIAELKEAGVVDAVRRVAEEKVATAKHALTVLPECKERQHLEDLVEFFISRSF